jgi:aryl-alcohol dehydrogenase-like predicted oxidoreductase
MEAYDRRASDRTWRVLDAVDHVAKSRGVSMAEVALAWVNNRAAVVSTIVGARTTQQLETNLRAAGVELSPEEYAVLDEASDLGASDYPYGELGVDQRRRTLDGG